MRRYWVLSSGTVIIMLVLTPYAIRLRDTSWSVGWSLILVGSIALLALLGLLERLTPSENRPTPADGPES